MNVLDIDATIVGPVVELRYGSHGEAVRQLYALREQARQRDLLLEAAALLLDAGSPHMTHRNAKERLAYQKLRAAMVATGVRS